VGWFDAEVPMSVRLGLAAIVGILLGLPYRRRPSAMRTHLFVTLGAAVFSVTAADLAESSGADPLRVLQGVASGVGFVGAASVLKKGRTISGLTEAASIWISAAIGCGLVLGDPWRMVVVALYTVAVGSFAERFMSREPRGRRRPPLQ